VQFYLLDGCCHSAGVPNAGELTQKLTLRCGFGAAISGNFSVLCIAENKGNEVKSPGCAGEWRVRWWWSRGAGWSDGGGGARAFELSPSMAARSGGDEGVVSGVGESEWRRGTEGGEDSPLNAVVGGHDPRLRRVGRTLAATRR
jgi:hypothetical protein